MGNIHSYKDLDVWKQGHSLVILIYLETQSFPKEELFGLVMQMRRASVSITSNIAEGFARRNKKEKIQFYSMSLGSLNEIQNQIQIAYDIKFINSINFNKLNNQCETVGKLIRSLIKSTQNKP